VCPALAKKIDNGIALIWRKAGFFCRDGAGRDHAETDCFTVQKFPVASGPLNCMADGVSEIEDRTVTGPIALILRDNAHFDLDVSLDQ